jgi:hypothetical protein
MKIDITFSRKEARLIDKAVCLAIKHMKDKGEVKEMVLFSNLFQGYLGQYGQPTPVTQHGLKLIAKALWYGVRNTESGAMCFKMNILENNISALASVEQTKIKTKHGNIGKIHKNRA